MHDDGPQTTPDDDHAPGDLRHLANDGGLSRREFVAGAGTVGIGLIASEWLDPLSRAGDTRTMTDSRDTFSAERLMPLSLSINGQQQTLQIDPRATLLDTLREGLHLFGTKKGCNHGQCGACTVLVNGRRVNSCLALALQHEGDAVITIEGLANGDDLHPVQAAFIKQEAEAVLAGEKPGAAIFKTAADAALKGARGYRYNAFKIELAKRSIVRALSEVSVA